MDKTKSRLAAFFDDDEDSLFPVRRIDIIYVHGTLTNHFIH
jgi:U2-associated protein SR140